MITLQKVIVIDYIENMCNHNVISNHKIVSNCNCIQLYWYVIDPRSELKFVSNRIENQLCPLQPCSYFQEGYPEINPPKFD